jgi:hypothetical protein
VSARGTTPDPRGGGSASTPPAPSEGGVTLPLHPLYSSGWRRRSTWSKGPPVTGSLCGDLIALLQEIRLGLQTPWVTALLREAGPRTPNGVDLYELLDRFWPERFRVSKQIFVRAVERGELPSETDPDFLLQVLSGPLYFRLLMLGRELDDEFLQQTADLVLNGARAGSSDSGEQPGTTPATHDGSAASRKDRPPRAN